MKNHSKYYRTFYLLLGIVLWCYSSFSQDLNNSITTINGVATFAAGKEIRVTCVDDMISNKRKVIACTKIDKEGNFTLSFKNPQIQLVQIAIQTSKADFYAEPNKTYHFTIDMDPQLFNVLDPMAYGGFLQIKESKKTYDINRKISHFENKFSDLVDYFSPTLLTEIKPAEIDSIHTYLIKDFPLEYEPTDFFKSYCFYSYGMFEMVTLEKDADSLYRKYLDNEYQLYENPAYMDFFNEFYHKYISSKINQEKIRDCINKQADYWALFNLLGEESLLVNQKIRELVIAQNLMNLYYEKDFNKKNVLTILQQLAQNTHFEEHKKIVNNIIYILEETGEGAPLPKAHFKEITGVDFDIESLKGKWVFIQLFNAQCQDCIRDMVMLQKMNEKYSNELAIVSLSIDFNNGHLLHFKDMYPQFDWTFVHFNNEYHWLDEMSITTLPDNMLLSPDGTLYQRYAADISRDLAHFLAKLFSKEEQEINPLIPQNKY